MTALPSPFSKLVDRSAPAVGCEATVPAPVAAEAGEAATAAPRVTAVQWDTDPVADGLDERVFTGNNGALVATAAQLYPFDGPVLDMTHGTAGGFWTVIRPADLTAIKPPASPDHIPIDFRNVPWPASTFTHVVFDPPYVAKGGRTTSTLHEMNGRYGMLTEGRNPAEQWERVILPGLSEAARLVRRGGLVWFKCMDYVTGGRVHWFTKLALSALAERGLVLEDEFILAGRPGPQPTVNRDGSPRRQVHAARAHSVLMIARKR